MNSGAYIGFKVNTKPLSKGYYLKNVASVFYDNNYAGSTNAVYCTLAITDIDDIDVSGKSIIVYPNPAGNTIHIAHPFLAGDKIKILNALGSEVYATTCNLSEGLDLDLTGLNTGVYILQIQSNGGLICRKFIKE